MSFQYLTGTATGIADWFATFQNWVSGLVGWTVEQGAGSTDLIIRSLGEDTAYTLLWARVWHVPATNTIGIEVRDDLAGTHQTNEAGRLDAGAGNFDYWMTADKEGAHITFKNAVAAWTHIYFGVTLPFALVIPDETYKTIVTAASIHAASVLRNYDDVWDVDITVYEHPRCDDIRVCPADGSFTPMGIFANDGGECVGQIPNMSGRINDGTIATETEITTQGEGAKETTWIVLQCGGGMKFAQRTGGDIPSGVPEGSFAGETGVAPDPQTFIETILPAFMTGIGWTDLGDPGLHTWARLFHSTGESGADDIYIAVCYNTAGGNLFHTYVQDDALGTHRTTTVNTPTDQRVFPASYFLAGDKDCLAYTVGRWGNSESLNWAGKVIPANRNLADSPYHMAAWAPYYTRRFMLRDHTGAWNQIVFFYDGEAPMIGSSPNLFDGQTYLLDPYIALSLPLFPGQYDVFGMPKYVFAVNGCANAGDIIPVADREYRVFYDSGLSGLWAMRLS